VADCTTRGHRIRIKVGRGFVQRQGERLQYEPEPGA
jgi:tRNA(Ile)-lysidine synthase